MIEDWKEFRSEIEQNYEKGQFSNGLRLLEKELSKTNIDPQIEKHWEEIVKLFVAQSEANFGPDIQSLSRNLSKDVFSVDANFKLGLALLQEKKAALAVGFLSMASNLDQEDPKYLTELTSALEVQGRNEEALALLKDNTSIVDKDNFLKYLKGFNAVVCNEIEIAKEVVNELDPVSIEPFPFLVNRLKGMIARHTYMEEYPMNMSKDLRLKYFIITGGILLNNEVHKAFWDSIENNKRNLIKLLHVLDVLELAKNTVLYPPEFGSKLLGESFGKMINAEASQWVKGGGSGLIMVYDSRDLIPEVLESLEIHHEDQYFFAMAANHTCEEKVAPDILGYFYEENTSPWGPGFTSDYDVIDRTSEPVQGLINELVEIEVAESLEEDRSFVAFLEAIKDAPESAKPALFNKMGKREKRWII